MSLTPSLTSKKNYFAKRKRYRSDRMMRVRLYMDSEQKDELKDIAERKGFTMTSYVSDLIRQVSSLVHRDSIGVEDIETKEDFVHIKLSIEEHLHLKRYAQMHRITIEQAAFSWFEYSKLSRTKKRADEKKFLVEEEEDDFWRKSEVKIHDWRESV